MADRAPKEAPEAGFYVYQHPSLGWRQYWLDRQKCLSVSKVMAAIGQGDGLQKWYAREERKGVIAMAAEVYGKALAEATEAAQKGATVLSLPSRELFESRLWMDVSPSLYAEDLRDEAADIGKEAHAGIEWWFRNGLFKRGFGPRPTAPTEFTTPEAERAFNAAIEFMRTEDVVPLAVERPVYSRELMTGGTMDHFALVRGHATIIDWKATKSLRYTHRVSTCGYVELYNACPEKISGVPDVTRALVIRLPKTKEDRVEFAPMGEDEVAEHRATFRMAVPLRRVLDKHGVIDWKPARK